MPVGRLESGRADAVLQLYSDATPHFAEIRRTQMSLRIGVGTVLIILYAALFFIAKRADDAIGRQTGQREADEAAIRHLAHHDMLTGLPNRKLFTDRLLVTLARAKRNGSMAALMFIDLDHFKAINDTLGHAAGDRVLQAAGNRLRGLLRDIDTVARLGGDEFTIILEDIADDAHVVPVAEKIKEAFAEPVVTENGTDIEVTLSIGIAFYPIDGEDVDALMQAADASMYEAKAAGRNTYRFYRPALALAAS
jgi:diguanylate cyclase (GGDEF)-like protein